MLQVKVVLYGKSKAGKSTLVRNIIPHAVNIDHHGRTTAMDYGKMHFGGCNLHFFGTPGQPHFRPVREVISRGMNTAVLVVDSTRCIDDEDRDLLTELDRAKVPYIIFLNQKPQTTASISSIETSLLGFSKPFGIVEGSAKTGDGIQNLLQALIGSIGRE
jgi:uncharacterized protein